MAGEPTLIERKRAWETACRAWSRYDCADTIKTVQLGETMMFAATDLISDLEAALQASEAAR